MQTGSSTLNTCVTLLLLTLFNVFTSLQKKDSAILQMGGRGTKNRLGHIPISAFESMLWGNAVQWQELAQTDL